MLKKCGGKYGKRKNWLKLTKNLLLVYIVYNKYLLYTKKYISTKIVVKIKCNRSSNSRFST